MPWFHNLCESLHGIYTDSISNAPKKGHECYSNNEPKAGKETSSTLFTGLSLHYFYSSLDS